MATAIRANRTIPPITPPAMAPVWLVLEDEEDVDEVALVPNTSVSTAMSDIDRELTDLSLLRLSVVATIYCPISKDTCRLRRYRS